MTFVLFCIGSYLLGSLPFGVFVSRAYGVDIMSVGSGNIGATNVWRTLGPRAGMLVFVLDIAKSALPAYVGTRLFGTLDYGFFAGLAAIAGHMWSPFLKFKGGKGIASGLGVLIGAMPGLAAVIFACFAVCLAVTRYVSLSSLITALVLAILVWVMKVPLSVQVATTLFVVFIFFKHRSNMSRLRAGTESKFHFKRTGAAKKPEDN